jgi:alanine dehydrogenase
LGGLLKTLILTDEEIRSLLSMKEVMEVVEKAFVEKALGYVQMPPKPYLFFPKYDGDLRVMPSYLERVDVAAVKVVNSHPNNPSAYSLPTVMATILLIDPRNGAPISIMGGTHITAMRTGAAGGIAAKYLARRDSRIVGLIGAGVQARTQLDALVSLYGKLEEVRVWSRSERTKEAFLSESSALYRKGEIGNMVPVNSVRDAVQGADIIVTTTPSRTPIVSNDWISEGVHLNCIGADAPGKQELDPEILRRAKIVVDDWEQASHGGEINVPLARGILKKEDVWGTIGEVIAGLKAGRVSRNEITVFTSTGLAIQDAVTARLAYERAASKGLGRSIELV